MSYLNLLNPKHSYFYGFCLMDGSLVESSRGRGKLSVELKAEDKNLLEEFSKIFKVKSSLSSRCRSTNFKDNYESNSIIFYDKDFREDLKSLGFPSGKKSEIIKLPSQDFSEKDFWRGVIDADGSLGMTSKGIPFISLTTKSEYIKDEFLSLIKKITNKDKVINRNKRDSVYNIMLNRESAQKLVEYLYRESSIHLSRKLSKSSEVLSWSRPEKMKTSSLWSAEEIDFIKNNTLDKSEKALQRSKAAILAKLAKV